MRMPISTRRLVLGAFVVVCCMARVGAQGQPPPPQPTTLDGAASHVYKSINGIDLRLHIFKPSDAVARPRPAIVFFFGGGWTGGTVNQFVGQSQHLAHRGMVAIVADYRVYGRHQTDAFAAIADAKSAIRWVRARAAELGIDPNRIAAGGGSAGGHLAAASASIPSFDEPTEDQRVSSRPNALVLFNPALNTARDSGAATGTAGATINPRFGDRGRDGSPFHHLGPGLPRTIIFHGKNDTTVPYTDVEQYCAAAVKHGNQCDLIGYEGATHGFFNRGNADGKWYRETLLEADRFLTRIGYLSSPSPTQIQR